MVFQMRCLRIHFLNILIGTVSFFNYYIMIGARLLYKSNTQKFTIYKTQEFKISRWGYVFAATIA